SCLPSAATSMAASSDRRIPKRMSMLPIRRSRADCSRKGAENATPGGSSSREPATSLPLPQLAHAVSLCSVIAALQRQVLYLPALAALLLSPLLSATDPSLITIEVQANDRITNQPIQGLSCADFEVWDESLPAPIVA